MTVGWVVGLDLGQSDDFTAWAVVESVMVPTGRVETVREDAMIAAFARAGSRGGGGSGEPRTFQRPERVLEHRLRHLERVRGQSYPSIVQRTGAILRELDALARLEMPPPADPYRQRTPRPPSPTLAVDATGVGRPVIDMLLAADLPAWVRPVTITGGDTATREGSGFRAPKRDLASALAVTLEGGRLKWPPGLPLRDVLETELRAFHVRVGAGGHDSYAARGPGDGWRERPHDDLVLATAMAVWMGEYADRVHAARPV